MLNLCSKCCIAFGVFFFSWCHFYSATQQLSILNSLPYLQLYSQFDKTEWDVLSEKCIYILCGYDHGGWTLSTPCQIPVLPLVLDENTHWPKSGRPDRLGSVNSGFVSPAFSLSLFFHTSAMNSMIRWCDFQASCSGPRWESGTNTAVALPPSPPTSGVKSAQPPLNPRIWGSDSKSSQSSGRERQRRTPPSFSAQHSGSPGYICSAMCSDAKKWMTQTGPKCYSISLLSDGYKFLPCRQNNTTFSHSVIHGGGGTMTRCVCQIYVMACCNTYIWILTFLSANCAPLASNPVRCIIYRFSEGAGIPEGPKLLSAPCGMRISLQRGGGCIIGDTQRWLGSLINKGNERHFFKKKKVFLLQVRHRNEVTWFLNIE